MKATLLTDLLQPRRQNKDEAGSQTHRHKPASLRNQTLNCLRVALAAATQAETARNALREKLAEDVAYAFDAAITTIGWLLPLTLFRSAVERVLFRKARYEVEKNLSRLSADWRDRVGVAIEDPRCQAEAAALDELTALERRLKQTMSNAPRLRQQTAELEAMSPT